MVRRITLISFLLSFGIIAGSCHTIECGDGTIELDGVCVPVNFPDATGGPHLCAPGTHWNSELARCFVDPEAVCGRGTEVVWNEDETEFTCVSTGEPELPECPPSTGPICINGRLRYLVDPSDATKFLTTEVRDASMLAQLEIVFYDPLEYAAVGSTAVPLGTAAIDPENGAFIATGISVPAQGYVGLVVRDKDWVAGQEPILFPFTGYAYKASPNVNIENSFGVVITKSQIVDFHAALPPGFITTACNQGDMYNCGTWIGVYRERTTQQPVSGVIPYWGTNFKIPAARMAFLDKDGNGRHTVLTAGTARGYTSDTGTVFYFGAELTNYFGLCDLMIDPASSRCLQWEMEYGKSLQGGSAQKTMFVQYVDGISLNNLGSK